MLMNALLLKTCTKKDIFIEIIPKIIYSEIEKITRRKEYAKD